MTCKDCIHYNVCQYHIDEETDMTVAECGNFKNKADFVEVVRCKDCKHYTSKESCTCYQWLYDDIDLAVLPDDFCSYGERK